MGKVRNDDELVGSTGDEAAEGIGGELGGRDDGVSGSQNDNDGTGGMS